MSHFPRVEWLFSGPLTEKWFGVVEPLHLAQESGLATPTAGLRVAEPSLKFAPSYILIIYFIFIIQFSVMV
jgi:hypothetical protein